MASTLKLDIDKADRLWADYAQLHDLTGRENEAVGIDPESGEMYFGPSAKAITMRLVDEGRQRPLYFRRVGSPYYQRKGGTRR